MRTVSATAPLLLWARRELRRRWLGFVVLGVVVGASAGLGIAAFDGAHRTNTAYQRMRSERAAADVVFTPAKAGLIDADFSLLDSLPEVSGWAGIGHSDSTVDGLPFAATPVVTNGAGWFDTVERATVLQGRMLDPSRVDEVVITAPVLTSDAGLHVGSVFTWRHLSRRQSDAFAVNPPPDDFDFERDAEGPATIMHVVGVVRLPIESVGSFASSGLVLASPGWATAHLDEISVTWTEGLVRLRRGPADVTAFEADIAGLYGRGDLPTTDLVEDVKRIDSALAVERSTLNLFAAAVALAGTVVGGQIIGRTTRAGTGAVSTLSAMGLANSVLIVGVVAPFVVSVGTGLVVCVAAAALLSERFPVGLARQLDPALGMHVDAGLLALGLAALGIFMLAAAAAYSIVAVRPPTRTSRPGRTRIFGRATRASVPVPAAVGLSLAVEYGRATRRSVQTTLVVAAIGVGGVVAATMVVAGIDDARDHPARSGVVWDVQGYGDPAHDSETLAASPAVTRSAFVSRFVTQVDGIDAPAYALSEPKGGLGFVIRSGRRPQSGEVAVGPRTAARLGVDLGDLIRVGPAALPERVVGKALLLQSEFGFDEGVWISSADMTLVLSAAGIADFSGYEQTSLIDLAPGVSVGEAADLLPTMFLSPPRDSPDVLNLVQVRDVPYALAGFLALLAFASMAHALATSGRARRGELAVLRALGLTSGQTVACVACQAAAIGAMALAIGLPVGLLAGTRLWKLIADALSIVDHPPLVTNVLIATVSIVFAALAALAIWPAVAAVRLKIFDELRSD